MMMQQITCLNSACGMADKVVRPNRGFLGIKTSSRYTTGVTPSVPQSNIHLREIHIWSAFAPLQRKGNGGPSEDRDFRFQGRVQELAFSPTEVASELVSGNVVINNELRDNGLPGVAFYSHVGPSFGLPPDNLNDNVIVGNRISGNGADLFDTMTPGPTGINVNSGGGGTPITGSVISQNVIKNEADDIVANTPAFVDVHLNDLLGKQTGVNNVGAGTVDATQNWWGCSGGPGANGCAGVAGSGGVFTPWLTKPF